MAQRQRSKQLQRQILALVNEWVPIVGLTHWSVTVEFDEAQNTATARAQPEYFTLRLKFNVKEILSIQRSKHWLSELVLHELCHALTWEQMQKQPKSKNKLFAELLDEQNERETSLVARAIWRARYGKEVR